MRKKRLHLYTIHERVLENHADKICKQNCHCEIQIFERAPRLALLLEKDKIPRLNFQNLKKRITHVDLGTGVFYVQ
jgi:hypothetical protein